MANKKFAIKKACHDKKIAAANKVIKSSLRKAVKKTSKKSELSGVYKTLDKAAKRGIIHKNKASRLKSKLAKKLG